MESGNGSASSKGFILPVATSSDVFQNDILAPLKSSYLYKESEHRFQYHSAVLIKNPAQKKKYLEFRAQKTENAYSDEDLRECYGFLLFDDFNKALALAETGLITGNCECTVLGDPQKGVSISLYSDCLDPNPWYHKKSGCIAIIRLTKGRVKTVSENYTQNFTEPTEGFDCHMSKGFLAVSPTTSSFLAFQRTRCYIYEQPDEENKDAIQCPRGASPFAIVTFSYTNTKEAVAASQKQSEQKELAACHYFPWKGKLQISVHSIDVGLRAKDGGAWIPVQLPPVVKVDQAIALSDLRWLLHKTVFENYHSGEVYLEGVFCSLFELISSEAKLPKLLSLLILEIKDKQLAPSVPLKDGGFLILLPPSLFHSYNGAKENVSDILYGLFVFPDSRLIQKDTKVHHQKAALSSEVLRVLPALSYAEGKVVNTSFHPIEDLCGLLVLHMQDYSALVHPGLIEGPSQEVKVFSDIDVHVQERPYSPSQCTFEAWQSLKSYFKTPVSFQLPVSKATEILQDDKKDEVEEEHDVFILPFSPELTEPEHVNLRPVDLLTGQKSAVHLEKTLDSSGEPKSGATDTLQSASANTFSLVETEIDTEKSVIPRMNTSVQRRRKNPTPSTSDLHHPTELIVSFTSAERAIADERVINDRHNLQLSHFSLDKVKAMDDQTVAPKTGSEDHELKFSTAEQSTVPKGPITNGQKHGSGTCDEACISQMNDDKWANEESCGSERTVLKKIRNTHSRKVKKNTLKKVFRNKEIRYFYACQREKRANLGHKHFGTFMNSAHSQKKMERWDLKPVISECGRILVPHGQGGNFDQTKAFSYEILLTKAKAGPPRKLPEVSISSNETNELKPKPIMAQEVAVTENEVSVPKDGGCPSENAVINQVNREHNVIKDSVNENNSLTLNSESTECYSKKDSLEKTFQENDLLSPEESISKSDALLNRLKSVLLRGKRKATTPVFEDTAVTSQGKESCLTKSKVYTLSTVQENINKGSCVQEPRASTREVPLRSVDPHFASALGLTPKQTTGEMHKNEGADTQQRSEPSDKQGPPNSDNDRSTQNSQQIYPRRGRIKALKKHQSLSTELVKKNWWLHFQNLTSVDNVDPTYSNVGEDNPDVKAATEKTKSASSTPDGLNLLADLALSATSYEQVSPQQEQAVEGRQETTLNIEPESVLHALLRQPTARQIQPPERPLLNPILGGADLTCLISKEHAYTFPQSSSLPLDLLVAPLQVSPLSGSTRLLHHQQPINCKEIESSYATNERGNADELNQKDPELQKKHRLRRKRFCRSRTFVNKDGCVQVTKHWKENYDFNFDSKFTNDSKYRAICRALHGPWDLSIQDTSEEVRLIFHMWIGLFYSRSTPRSFHLDTDCPSPSIEGSEALNLHTNIGPAVAQSFGPCLNVPDTSDTSNVNAVDLTKKDDFALDGGSNVLDLSQKHAQAKLDIDPNVKPRQTSALIGRKEAAGAQITFESTPVLLNSLKARVSEENDCRETDTSQGTCEALQQAGSASKTFSSLEPHGTLDSQQDYTPKIYGGDHVELKNNAGKNSIDGHEKVESRISNLFNKREQLVQEVPFKLSPEKCRIGQFENVVVKEDQPQKGSKLLPQQRTDAGEFKAVEDMEKMERMVKNDNLGFPSERSHSSAFIHVKKKQRNENKKPLQESCRVPPQQSIHKVEFKDLEDWDKEENQVKHVSQERSSKRMNVDESQEGSVSEVKENSTKEDCMDLSSAGICADKFKDGVNLEMKATSTQGLQEVVSAQSPNPEKFGDAEHSVKLIGPTKINTSDVSQEIHIEGENLATVQPCRSKSRGASQWKDHNEDDDCAAQKMTDLTAKEDLQNSNLTMDFEADRDPNRPVCTTRGELDVVKGSNFSVTPCQTSLDQQTATKDGENSVPDLEFDVKVCNSLARSCDDIVPKTCTTECTVQAPLLKQSSHVTQDKNTLRDLQFKLLRTKGSSLVDQTAIPAKTSRVPSQLKCIREECTFLENSEKAFLFSSTDEHNDESTDRQGTLPSKNCSSTKNDTTVIETGVASSSSTDCEMKKTEGTLEKMYTPPVNHLTGLYTPCKNEVQSLEMESEGKVANTRSPIDPLVCETIEPKTCLAPNTGGALFRCPEICGPSSTPEVTEKVTHAEVLGSGAADRCPTPTMDEEPYVACYNLTSSNESGSATHLTGKETHSRTSPVCPVQNSTLIENSTPLSQHDAKDPDPHRHPNTDVKLKTQDAVLSTDGNRFVPSDENLQLLTENVDNKNIDKRHENLEQISPSLEVCLNSQHPVMTVKPSDSDETQGLCVSPESLGKMSLKSHYSDGEPPIHLLTTPDSIPLNKNMGEDMKESNSDSASSEVSKSSKILSSHLEQSSQGDEDAPPGRESVELEQQPCSLPSTSSAGDSDDGVLDHGFVLRPRNSLACTIFNTNNNRAESFLEKLSKRCVQEDPTQASMERECLIFSEQMRQLLKMAKCGPVQFQEARGKINMSCPSPVTVRFSDLEDVETEVKLFDESSFVLPKIKVDNGDRKTLADTSGGEMISCPQEDSHGAGAPASVSGVTAECARLYTSAMDDVCGVSSVPLGTARSRVLPRTRPSDNFKFCHQMKREVDYNFCSSMNSVVRKFCKANYKFFILTTSNDVFFQKTKVHLELEGHTAVHPSELFLGDDSSTILIILRNEDIVKHICEVPNLLMLKRSRGVRFAGIDEPDDVVNLTYQELFVKGGFILFDRAILECLSLCDMEKMSEIFHELSKTGKWKWMLHYRDSRRLKENARFSAEAEERKNFISWWQDIGILEVLPYHECDPLSKDQPDYLSCMIRLQVQNISSRYSVFVTDEAVDCSFGKNGILTFTLQSFLTCCPSELLMV